MPRGSSHSHAPRLQPAVVMGAFMPRRVWGGLGREPGAVPHGQSQGIALPPSHSPDFPRQLHRIGRRGQGRELRPEAWRHRRRSSKVSPGHCPPATPQGPAVLPQNCRLPTVGPGKTGRMEPEPRRCRSRRYRKLGAPSVEGPTGSEGLTVSQPHR